MFGISMKVIVVVAVVVIVEFIKKVICKSDPKYKLIYVLSPIVLCAIAFLVIALVQHTDVLTSVLTGVTLGLTAMGSYDAIVNVLVGWKDKTPQEIADEVEKIIDKGQKAKEIANKNE